MRKGALGSRFTTYRERERCAHESYSAYSTEVSEQRLTNAVKWPSTETSLLSLASRKVSANKWDES